MKNTFYVTTPIYYVNALPHIGHAYTSFAADILARYHRLRGDDVFFLTGTDEHAQKNVEAATRAKKPTDEYVREMSATWQEYFDELGLTNDDFIRTTEERHIVGVRKFVKAVWDKGDIYKGAYRGLYCVGCEAFKTETDLANGLCPDHRVRPQEVTEENYFFRITKYRQALLDHIRQHPEFVQPESRRNEIVRYITDAMTDISITRPAKGWGIPFPYDESQTIYVWFDALVNYLTGVGYGTDDQKFEKYWPANVHVVGKDILKFHCALWPAMLMSAGLLLPKRVFAHGYFTVDGQKISKTLGNVVDSAELVKKYGLDAVRYFLLREIQFGNDGDYSESRFRERYNADLANGLGNFAARVLAMMEKYCGGKVPPVILSEMKNLEILRDAQDDRVGRLDLSEALAAIWSTIGELDTYIDNEKPWLLAKTDPKRLDGVLYVLGESLRQIAVHLWPFMPSTAENILDQLGVLDISRQTTYTELISWGLLKSGIAIKRGASLFPRLI